MQNSQYVNGVYSLGQAALDRYYDTVFLTHSFGGTRIPLTGRRVIWARDWQEFAPGRSLHETIYNLEAAKELLGIPYDDADARGYYVANRTLTRGLVLVWWGCTGDPRMDIGRPSDGEATATWLRYSRSAVMR